MNTPLGTRRLGRRELLGVSGLALLGSSLSGWLPALADAAAQDPKRRRHCVLLWMNGGPSQTDTFDMKPGHANGGEFKPAATAAPGLQFSEHLPKLAKLAKHLAVIRGLSTKEGDHGRATYLMRTGHQPTGPIRYPTIGASLAKELADAANDLPAYVSISPYRVFNQAAFGPGFLGPKHAPLTVGASDAYQPLAEGAPLGGFPRLTVDDLNRPADVSGRQAGGRLELWRQLQGEFLKGRPGASPAAHDTVYRRAVRMMRSRAAKAFDLEEEPTKVREAYGRSRFGQGCLMARRLIERGVAFVEVSLGTFGGGAIGWDTHRNNFDIVRQLSAELDAGWATLMSDLAERGLLERTTIIWMGEFGRTPKINGGGGRDHYPKAWSAVLGGGGINGGGAYGATSADGQSVVRGKCDVPDVLATLCAALGIDPQKHNPSGVGRPIRITEGEPIKELLG